MHLEVSLMEYRERAQFSVYDESAEKRLVFLQKVYLSFFFSLIASVVGSVVGLQPQFLRYVAQSRILFFIGTLVALFAAYGLRRVPGLNFIALFGFTFLSGMSIAPLLAYYLGMGEGILIKEAFVLTTITFGGLSVYVFVTKKDFSYLGGALFIGLFALIGVGLVFMFFGPSQGVYTIFCAFGAILFCGFILYDTSRMMREWQNNDYIAFAIELYLDFLNLFLYILRLLGSSRD